MRGRVRGRSSADRGECLRRIAANGNDDLAAYTLQ